jgi:hypothetical protein
MKRSVIERIAVFYEVLFHDMIVELPVIPISSRWISLWLIHYSVVCAFNVDSSVIVCYAGEHRTCRKGENNKYRINSKRYVVFVLWLNDGVTANMMRN